MGGGGGINPVTAASEIHAIVRSAKAYEVVAPVHRDKDSRLVQLAIDDHDIVARGAQDVSSPGVPAIEGT